MAKDKTKIPNQQTMLDLIASSTTGEMKDLSTEDIHLEHDKVNLLILHLEAQLENLLSKKDTIVAELKAMMARRDGIESVLKVREE